MCTHCSILDASDVSGTIGNGFSNRIYLGRNHEYQPPSPPKTYTGRVIGQYALTSSLSSWATEALNSYQPDDDVVSFVAPFSTQLHAVIDKERESSSGLHDLDVVEFTYQVTLEVGAAVLLAADSTTEPIETQQEFHSSKAAKDDHFSWWGRLLTGLECDPPIIAMFPVYLMMCKAFTFESNSTQADYVYAALTGVD